MRQKISCTFTSDAYDYLNQVTADIREPTKIRKKSFVWLRLNFRTKSLILQSVNLLDYNCLTPIFFKTNLSCFEGSLKLRQKDNLYFFL